MKLIDFKSLGGYFGRNGHGNAIGLKIEKILDDKIVLFPVNTKNKTGSCHIIIPVDSIPELTKTLSELKPL